MRTLPLSVLVLLFIAAGPPAASAQDYFSDVRPVLVERCVGCHSESGIAWSMEDADETFERRRRIARAVLQRRMPPWLAEGGHQQYLGDLSLISCGFTQLGKISHNNAHRLIDAPFDGHGVVSRRYEFLTFTINGLR